MSTTVTTKTKCSQNSCAGCASCNSITRLLHSLPAEEKNNTALYGAEAHNYYYYLMQLYSQMVSGVLEAV